MSSQSVKMFKTKRLQKKKKKKKNRPAVLFFIAERIKPGNQQAGDSARQIHPPIILSASATSSDWLSGASHVA